MIFHIMIMRLLIESPWVVDIAATVDRHTVNISKCLNKIIYHAGLNIACSNLAYTNAYILLCLSLSIWMIKKMLSWCGGVKARFSNNCYSYKLPHLHYNFNTGP